MTWKSGSAPRWHSCRFLLKKTVGGPYEDFMTYTELHGHTSGNFEWPDFPESQEFEPNDTFHREEL
jgi:hypothetical protein